MSQAGTILRQLCDALQARDMAKARSFLADDIVRARSAFDGRPFAAMFSGR